MNRLVRENDTQYTFDDFGNRATMTEENTTTTYTYDLNNRLTESNETTSDTVKNTKYFYDNNGNTVSKAVMTNTEYTGDNTGYNYLSEKTDENIALYEYNCYNQVIGIDTNGVKSTYTYLPDGLRQSKTVGEDTITFVYDNSNVVEEISDDSVNKYYRGFEIIKNDDGLYYIYNGQGDVAYLADNTGKIKASYIFDAYGNTESENDVYNPFGYRGEYQDSETGLIYLRARMYDPETGRFINEDPVKDGYNWYMYCSGNPIMFVDPLGLWESGDEKYSTTVQAELLKLTVAWHVSNNETDKKVISERAVEIRNAVDGGFGKFLDTGKSITGAAADEFSWFLGGDVGRAERDYWLQEAQRFQPNITVNETSKFSSFMFVASIISPSAEDAWKLISKKASKEMLETVGEKGAKRFYKAATRYAGKQGENGIKKLSGKGITVGNKVYQYEVKVVGKSIGKYRLLGNIDESGNLIFEVFEKTH